MKITMAQINTTPNDFSGNFTKIQVGVEKAKVAPYTINYYLSK